jgi:hypothetical protein
LDNPLKRGGFIVFFVGISLLVAGLSILLYEVNYYGYSYGYNQDEMYRRYANRLVDVFLNSIKFLTHTSYFNWPLGVGFYFSIIGYLFSFSYEKGIGRIVRWISKG